MKLHQILFYFFICHVLVSVCQDENLCTQAHDLFLQSRHEQACHAYEKIENKTFPILYNMSLLYLYQGKYAQALVCCKRAEKIASFQELTLLYELLGFIKKQHDSEYEVGLGEQIAIFFKKCILSISMFVVQWGLLFLLLCLFLVWWYRLWLYGYTKFLYAHVAACIFFGLIWHYKVIFLQKKTGVVIKSTASVYAGPDSSFYKKLELHEADEIVVLTRQKDYCQIQRKGLVGWIDVHDIELI